VKIYHYHRDTKIFVAVSEARLDPLETEKAKEAVYLIPAYATTQAPPEVIKGVVAVYDEKLKTWITMPDYRGTPLYSTITGNVVTKDHIGQVPDELTETPPLEDPCYWEGGKWVVDEKAIQERELAAKISSLKSHDIALFKMICELFNVGRDKGVWKVSDFPTALVDEVQTIKAKLDEIESGAT
jgi:hypothetical protein